MRREELQRAVIAYQIERLQRDYADVVSDPKHRVVGDFFFHRVYGAPDKEARDEGGRKLIAMARKLLGEEIGGNLGRLVRLNELTDRLDACLVDKMLQMEVERFSEGSYEEAYRLCDNYKERKEQIELVVESLEYFHRLAFIPGIGVGLTFLKPYAALKGATAVYRFLRDGYRGFRTIKDVAPFVKIVRERELARLDRIYGRNGHGNGNGTSAARKTARRAASR